MNACCSDRAHDCYVLQAVAQMAWCHVLTLQHLLMPHCPTAVVPRELSPSGRHRGQPRVLHHTSSMLSKSSATRQTRKTLATGHQQRTTFCVLFGKVSPFGRGLTPGWAVGVRKSRSPPTLGTCLHNGPQEPRSLDRGPPGPSVRHGNHVMYTAESIKKPE
jgi:hypothetical protein